MKINKILLIEVGTKLSIFPPLGLMCIASVIRDKYKIIIKDYSGKKIDEQSVKRDIEKINPEIIGLHVLTGPHIPRALIISKIAKKFGKIVIWGGPHPTVLPEQTIKNEYIDAVVIGEGEYAFQDLLKYFEGKLKKPLGCGIKEKVRGEEKIKIMLPQKKFVDFKKLPLPSWDLLENINRYFPEKRHNVLPLSTTRSCIYKCGFCHNSNENVKRYLGHYRIAEPQRGIKEYKFVQSLIKNKIDYLDVGEDLHLISYDYAKKFCEAIEKSGEKNLMWNTSTRYEMINKKIIDLIAAYNCKRVLLGIESGSKRLQELNGKIVEFNRTKKLAKYMRKKKLFVTNAYIFGHPTETAEELKMSLKYIKEVPADENLIQLYRPMPGTPYFKICQESKKLKVPKKLEGWKGFGILGHDVNVSKISDKFLFSTFYKTNAWQQTKYIFNLQRYYLQNNFYIKFFKNIIDNRFTFKLN